MTDPGDPASRGNGKRPDPGHVPESVFRESVFHEAVFPEAVSPEAVIDRGRVPTRPETRRRFQVMSALALDALRASRSYVLHYRAERGAE